MARAAFLNSAVGRRGKMDETLAEEVEDEVSRPSIFTIVASDGLMTTIRPALEHVIRLEFFRMIMLKIQEILSCINVHQDVYNKMYKTKLILEF